MCTNKKMSEVDIFNKSIYQGLNWYPDDEGGNKYIKNLGAPIQLLFQLMAKYY